MKYYFSLYMSREDFMPYYTGQLSTVVTRATNGQNIQFPAMHLRKFMTNTGIKGAFCLETDNNKFISLKKI